MGPIDVSSIVVRPTLASFSGREAESTVVWLRGEHDVCTVAELSATMAHATALDDGDLIVDLSGVAFMDAASLRVIMGTREHLAEHSRSLALRSPSTCARRLLDLCGLSNLLDPHPVEPAIS